MECSLLHKRSNILMNVFQDVSFVEKFHYLRSGNSLQRFNPARIEGSSILNSGTGSLKPKLAF